MVSLPEYKTRKVSYIILATVYNPIVQHPQCRYLTMRETYGGCSGMWSPSDGTAFSFI